MTRSRCGKEYTENTQVNMVTNELGEIPKPGTAIGYESTPYINAIQILSTSGNGRKLGLCDDCVVSLLTWLRGKDTKHGYWTGRTFMDDSHAEGFPYSVSEATKQAIRENEAHVTHCSVCGGIFDDRYIKGWKGCPRCLSILDLKTPPNAYSLAWESKMKDIEESVKRLNSTHSKEDNNNK